MKAKFRLLGLVLLFSASSVFAGTWSLKSFDNDDALDWVENELKEDSQQAVRGAIGYVVTHKDYLEAPQCCYAVAACEVLAAGRGKPSPDLPKDVAAPAKTLPAKTIETLRKDAIKALERIATESELRDLMKESGGLEKWLKLVDELKARLS